jgi:hypothetical protein
LVHYHRDFEVNRDKIITKDDCAAWYGGETIEQEKKYHIFLTKTYIHSGVVLALDESGREFPDERWDVSRCGCVLVSKKETRSKKKAYKLASNLIDIWNDYLSGNVYGYKTDTGDAVGGYYGDWNESGCLAEAKASIDYAIKKNKEKNDRRLKGQIRNKVPLEKRQMAEI